ncbi:MAG TPA: acyl-CoA dehydrogenase [Acidimicrobiales bacterium]|nr:acyl-CoA dehydrogenase [Acidimicrobiales bacterium]
MLEGQSIAIGDDHVALAETVRKFASQRITSAVMRGYDAAFWKELADLGWLGLHLPEDAGGSGFGMLEAAIVLEELGRACAPGPMLTTVWASALLHLGGHDVAKLAAGEEVGAVSLDGDWALNGATADVLVCPLDGEWVVSRDFTATAVESLDPTRPLARVDIGSAEPVGHPHAGGYALAYAAALFAADAAGGAGWCVATAADYAAVRQQFGRPIGQFQGVKHRCANMLVATEQIRGVAWDAALSIDGGGDEEMRLATAAAGAIALDKYCDVAKDCIQVLGGIGFTWEHDAHFYLRRAMATRQLLGGSAPWRKTVADVALEGTRRHLSVDLPQEAEAIRPAVAAFADGVAALPREQQRRAVVDGGYFVPHWDEPWGRNAQAVEQLVIDDEFAQRKIRRPHLQIGAWAAPTIAAHGTPAQQERWVRPTLLGEVNWCQLFSEPEAGSDLAALKTTATKIDGGWLLNGQKVWTSFAREADWGMCLARTNPHAAKHLGITYFIVDMKSEGLDIRPLKEMTGLEMFNEVFINDVFVPDDNVIGDVDGGWPLARTTLANERVAMGSGSSFGGGIEALLGLCAEVPLEEHRDELGALVAESHTVALLGLRSTHRSVSGAKPGPEASVRKLLGVEHDQRTQEFGLALLGPEGATTVGRAQQWTFGFLANRCLTIAGGTSEIQRNVIGERLLGLPRDPEPAGSDGKEQAN